jgi:hypothetical protein
MTTKAKEGALVPASAGEAAPAIGVEALQLQAADEQETSRVLARYGYADTTLDQLVSDVRQRVQRSTADMLEIGRAVCCLRELPRGRYGEAIKAIGLSPDTARRLGAVAAKFLGKETLRPLLSFDQSKVYELALLDNAELEGLAEDPAQLDQVERMSVSELRIALRATRHDAEAKDDRLRQVHEENAALRDKEANRTKYRPSLDAQDAHKRRASRSRILHEGALQAIAQFNHFGVVLNDVLADCAEAEREHALQTARWLAQQLAGLYLAHGIDVDFQEVITPSWLSSHALTVPQEG